MNLDAKGYRLDSQNLRESGDARRNKQGWWYYEDDTGIDIYHDHDGKVSNARIPKEKLLAYARVAESAFGGTFS